MDSVWISSQRLCSDYIASIDETYNKLKEEKLLGKSTLETSEEDVDKTTLETSEEDVDKATLKTSEEDVDKTALGTSEEDVDKTTLETSELIRLEIRRVRACMARKKRCI